MEAIHLNLASIHQTLKGDFIVVNTIKKKKYNSSKNCPESELFGKGLCAQCASSLQRFALDFLFPNIISNFHFSHVC